MPQKSRQAIPAEIWVVVYLSPFMKTTLKLAGIEDTGENLFGFRQISKVGLIVVVDMNGNEINGG